MATVQGLKEQIESGKEELERVEAELERARRLACPTCPTPTRPTG